MASNLRVTQLSRRRQLTFAQDNTDNEVELASPEDMMITVSNMFAIG
jgi:hypothetical protein